MTQHLMVDDDDNVLLPLEQLVDRLSDAGKARLLVHLACDDQVIGWVVDQLADNCFEPDPNKVASRWSGSGHVLDKQRARLDAKMSDVTRRRIRELQHQIDLAYRYGTRDAQSAIYNKFFAADPGSPHWTRLCELIEALDAKRPTAVTE